MSDKLLFCLLMSIGTIVLFALDAPKFAADMPTSGSGVWPFVLALVVAIAVLSIWRLRVDNNIGMDVDKRDHSDERATLGLESVVDETHVTSLGHIADARDARLDSARESFRLNVFPFLVMGCVLLALGLLLAALAAVRL